MKKMIWTGALAACVFTAGGCAPEETSTENETTEIEGVDAEQETVSQEPDNQQESVKEPKQEESYYEAVEPLTGEGTNEVPPERPLAVMINNHPDARPQTGLADADIVYEALTEGELTRFLAIYQSAHPEEIGPVRSARDYFVNLAEGYDAMYVAHGWSPGARRMLQSGGVPYLNGLFYDGTLFHRSNERRAPHNSYIDYEDAVSGLENKGYELQKDVPANFYKKDGFSASSAAPAEDVSVWYSDKYVVQFSYNQEDGTYERSSDNTAFTGEKAAEQIEASNVFIIEAPHRVVDEAGRRKINIEDGGSGLLLQHGEALEVQWRNEGGRLLPYKNGEKVPFQPGKTWINVIPASPGLEESVEGIES
ncbi:DUF3048 domain-containing protein [Salibacterium halotolerans]|uniref:Lipoprotein YerB n=1 Tax=Salibacterium halotolerans TaxID=1884432 RepID=A0A1I5PF78_9BACI|nr:DUF3048 domain-containing protein [Salibacterium halotolerans]SFP32695.1 Protein of unknown function [Salibacterium halotolerans]